MKTIHTYILSIFCSFTLCMSSCSFLEVDVIGKTTIPNFFSDMDGLRASIPGAYTKVYNYYNGIFYEYPEIAGNMLTLTPSGRDLQYIVDHDFLPENEIGPEGSIWTSVYEALANVNNIIQYIPDLLKKFPECTKEIETAKAEALFLRALIHFDLCRVYAQPYNYTPNASHIGIPIIRITPGANDNVKRMSVFEVYKFIIEDLNEAERLFDNTKMKSCYYASKTSVAALLSRVYLYKEDWDNCITYSTKAINDIPLAKGDDYIDMFTDLEKTGEVILRFNGNDKNGSLYNFFDEKAVPDDTIYTLFPNNNDLRLKLLYTTSFDGMQQPRCLKYKQLKVLSGEEKRNDPIVFRVSEMYLNRAEAYLNKENSLPLAANDVKEIIARGINKTTDEVSVPSNNKETLFRIIETERVKELCFEGHCLYDITRRKQSLIRSKNMITTRKRIDYPSNSFVLPITMRELNANPNMQQNPGY